MGLLYRGITEGSGMTGKYTASLPQKNARRPAGTINDNHFLAAFLSVAAASSSSSASSSSVLTKSAIWNSWVSAGVETLTPFSSSFRSFTYSLYLQAVLPGRSQLGPEDEQGLLCSGSRKVPVQRHPERSLH